MAVTVREVNGEELEQLLNTDKRVLVDFYSSTCGPCKMLSFVLNDVAKEVDDVEIVKIDFDLNKTTVEKHGVAGYPTLILFDNGQEVERMKGLQQKPAIVKLIKG
ncbi:MAG: thioredoxin domain-containing protein [Peptococcales bacterium]|jgi:thioredoxin 1